eukprot:TRINITY_DN14236_c0_g1_i1.p1 TRINITY_DN14236_c0_g1~~TRINITY_DN14236_c0_g1_i1.p1  ORF type:complete len:204 (+),score=61.30 TRINITY_DN14236_c0_g1_i1:51-614(+)
MCIRDRDKGCEVPLDEEVEREQSEAQRRQIKAMLLRAKIGKEPQKVEPALPRYLEDVINNRDEHVEFLRSVIYRATKGFAADIPARRAITQEGDEQEDKKEETTDARSSERSPYLRRRLMLRAELEHLGRESLREMKGFVHTPISFIDNSSENFSRLMSTVTPSGRVRQSMKNTPKASTPTYFFNER